MGAPDMDMLRAPVAAAAVASVPRSKCLEAIMSGLRSDDVSQCKAERPWWPVDLRCRRRVGHKGRHSMSDQRSIYEWGRAGGGTDEQRIIFLIRAKERAR